MITSLLQEKYQPHSILFRNDARVRELEGLPIEHHTIGHAFFIANHLTAERLASIWSRRIGPLIEEYFQKMAQVYPNDYVPYLGLGDMYTSLDRLDQAQVAYEEGYKRAPQNAALVAGGANAVNFLPARYAIKAMAKPMNHA